MQFRIPNYSSYIYLAEMSKYQHMWSFFGRSENYNIFIGISEFLIGALVLFKRTRLIALLISLGVCLNILVLNIEFEIIFATSHIILDFAITLILLIGYRKDLYQFFIKLGGKLDSTSIKPKHKFAKIFPVVFLLVLSVGYFSFSLYIKSVYIGDPNVIGAYEIKQIQLKDSTFTPKKGKLGKLPMLFIENNNQIVLSVEDTLYIGAYLVEKENIHLGFEGATKFGLQTLKGTLDSISLTGQINDKSSIDISLERIDGKKNYINDLYK
ncbi:hypothetical protein [uncultured Kordia sp.]|uniref:hypothetical protein n=1 Tax=uncultured Kordia sp. TaxID=507699 RepID=UPI00263A1F98|nr:hypothetical protein [uncultured Kordia sp.]